VKDKRGCTNCLSFAHFTSECPSSHTCRECNGKHNTLLHRPSTPSNNTTTSTQLMALNVGTSPTQENQTPPRVSFLHTARAKASLAGRTSDVRLILDTGASSSLVTESLASRLKLKRHPRRLNITGACGGGVSRHFVELTLRSIHNDEDTFTTKLNVVKSLPSAPPPADIEAVKAEAHLKGLPLALDISACVLGSLTKGTDSEITAQPTIFGWTVSGPLDHVPSQSSVLQLHTSEDNLQESLNRLWELDRTPELAHLTAQEEEITQHFLDTHQRDEDGRYIVKLPRVPNPAEIGTSRSQAIRRFQQNDKSLTRKGKAEEFHGALSEYLHLDHSEVVSPSDIGRKHYYLPMGCLRTPPPPPRSGRCLMLQLPAAVEPRLTTHSSKARTCTLSSRTSY